MVYLLSSQVTYSQPRWVLFKEYVILCLYDSTTPHTRTTHTHLTHAQHTHTSHMHNTHTPHTCTTHTHLTHAQHTHTSHMHNTHTPHTRTTHTHLTHAQHTHTSHMHNTHTPHTDGTQHSRAREAEQSSGQLDRQHQVGGPSPPSAGQPSWSPLSAVSCTDRSQLPTSTTQSECMYGE